MTIIDVDSVGFDNLFELVDETLTSCFDTQNVVDFDHVVRISFLTIDLEMRKTLFEIGSVSLKNNIFGVLFGLFINLLLLINIENNPLANLNSLYALDATNKNIPHIGLNSHHKEIHLIKFTLPRLKLRIKQPHSDERFPFRLSKSNLFINFKILFICLL